MAQIDCWSCKQLPSILEDDFQEQVLMLGRGELPLVSLSGPLPHAYHPHRRWGREKAMGVKNIKGFISKVGRNISVTMSSLSQAIATESSSKQNSKDECRKLAWSLVIKTLMQRHPGSQLPERLISSIRKHFDSLPVSYARAGFNSEQVFLHIRLLDQGRLERSNLPICIQELQCGSNNSSQLSSNFTSPSGSDSWDDEDQPMVEFMLTFACSGTVSKSTLACALKQVEVSMKHFQLFEVKALSLGILVIQGSRGSVQPEKVDAAVRKAVQKSKLLKFNLNLRGTEKLNQNLLGITVVDGRTTGEPRKGPDLDAKPEGSSCKNMVLPPFEWSFPENIELAIDPKQGIISGRDELQPWLLDAAKMEMVEPVSDKSGKAICRGVYDGCQVILKDLKGCKSTTTLLEANLKRVLDLDAWPHKNILPLLGIFVDCDRHRMFAVTKYLECESLRGYLHQREGIPLQDKVKLALDIAEGVEFLHRRGIVHRDLSAENVFIDNRGTAFVGGLDAAQFPHEDGSEAYEIGSYHSISPEVLKAAPGRASASSKSNVYSFGIILWEIITNKVPFVEYSPLQAVVAISMHGQRPTIPVNCYAPLRYLMQHCWSSDPSDRPRFTAILEILHIIYKGLSRSTTKVG